MLDNSFQINYSKLPIATYAIVEPPVHASVPFMNMHYHREFEVIVIVTGAAQVMIDQILYEVSAGDILLIPPLLNPQWGHPARRGLFAFLFLL